MDPGLRALFPSLWCSDLQRTGVLWRADWRNAAPLREARDRGRFLKDQTRKGLAPWKLPVLE